MIFLKLHSLEFGWRSLYTGFAFLGCFCICYYNSEIFLTSLSYPYLKLNAFKRLIALNVTELFFLSIYIASLFSLLFTYPFIVYQIYLFFCNAWFRTQLKDYLKITFFLGIHFILWSLVCYVFFIPEITSFFLQWELKSSQSILLLDLEPRISTYLDWILPIINSISSIGSIISFVVLFFLLIPEKKILLLNLIRIRKLVSLVLLSTSLLVIPIEWYQQLLVYILFYLVFEIYIFVCCWF
uniref:SecY-independent transporter protein n=1 Tax=Pseudoerythrocladia kornmannii TaxID=753682 RepID=UPI001FCE0760|nr:SecY-independent transporter protein [Pseudoerythrocladia kornmannii]UNJ19037.1 SecY-independent transporter protein [Pseudoerythrocladia kornmannii]